MEPSTIQNVHQHKNTNHDPQLHNTDTDFAFNFSYQLNQPSITAADELFDCGKIKPLDPSPHCPQPPSCSPKTHNKNYIKSLPFCPQNQTTTTTKHKLVSDILSEDIKVTKNDFSLTSPFGFIWYNKWNLKNLLLFRSTSEGSAVIANDVKNSSFRSTDGSVGSTSRKMKRKVSAHELHYTANRAVAKEMRRKTFLPYKAGLLGCLGFGHNLQDISSRGRL
ncbi:uncharacterized protein [Rutidosis leptorrhynchoides]|uniref:uncharacterized protein n=1 Tax=Rutidosis leptorrhynchoides TaxID=125765 RepID=UPI003A9976D2